VGGAFAAAGAGIAAARRPAAPASTIQLGVVRGAPPGATQFPARAPAAVPAAASDDDARLAWWKAVAAGPQPPAASVTSPAEAPPESTGAPPSPPGTSWEQASRSVRIIVYTTGWCPHCKRAKAWMSANGVPFEERNIESSRLYAQENRSINPRGSIPTFDVEGQVMVGFSEGDLVAMIQRAAQRHEAQR
jgi:glutaredoxin